MKKKLEADLISIAHRILQIKNKSDVNLLFLETQKLYEKLAVLKFVGEHLNDLKPTINTAFIETKIASVFEKQEVTPNQSKTAVENDAIQKKNISVEETKSKESIENDEVKLPLSLEDILGEDYAETEFVKAETIKTKEADAPKETIFELSFEPVEKLIEEKEAKKQSLNEKRNKKISIDLNDRIGFVKHLFNNSIEEYNQILSQLNTFTTFYETKKYVDEVVKKKYNNWEDKEEYVIRFMENIENRFL